MSTPAARPAGADDPGQAVEPEQPEQAEEFEEPAAEVTAAESEA